MLGRADLQNHVFEPLSTKVEKIGEEVIDSSVKVHRAMGPGLLESVYEECMTHELSQRGLSVARQVILPICYDGHALESGLRLDLLVEELVVVELKSVEKLLPVHEAQLMTYLRLSGRRLGFLINFNMRLVKDGIKRMVM